MSLRKLEAAVSQFEMTTLEPSVSAGADELDDLARALYELQPRVLEARAALRQEAPGEPTVADIACRVGIPEQRVREVRASVIMSRPVPLDGADAIGMPSPSAQVDLTMVDVRGWLRLALGALADRERTMVVLRFVWDLSQTQIPVMLGVSQIQVCRGLRSALDKLRSRVGVVERGEPWP